MYIIVYILLTVLILPTPATTQDEPCCYPTSFKLTFSVCPSFLYSVPVGAVITLLTRISNTFVTKHIQCLVDLEGQIKLMMMAGR